MSDFVSKCLFTVKTRRLGSNGDGSRRFLSPAVWYLRSCGPSPHRPWLSVSLSVSTVYSPAGDSLSFCYCLSFFSLLSLLRLVTVSFLFVSDPPSSPFLPLVAMQQLLKLLQLDSLILSFFPFHHALIVLIVLRTTLCPGQRA